MLFIRTLPLFESAQYPNIGIMIMGNKRTELTLLKLQIIVVNPENYTNLHEHVSVSANLITSEKSQ